MYDPYNHSSSLFIPSPQVTLYRRINYKHQLHLDELYSPYKMGQFISLLFTNNKVYFPLGVCCWTYLPLSDNLLLSYSWTFLITDYLTGSPGSDCSFFQFLVYHVVLFGIIMSDMKIHEYSWFVMERIKTGFIISPHCSFSIFLMISIIDQFSVKLTPDNNRRLCGTVDTARPK